jgi:nucleoside-diphosphate-sugar epimerase
LSDLVLVTGGSGVLGRRVMERLRSEQWRTRALVHHTPVHQADESVSGDLSRAETLAPAVAGVTHVLHLAAVTHARTARQYDDANVTGTRNLLAAATHAGVARFVHVSTRAIDERGGAYSRSKAEAERLVRDGAPRSTIVRLPEVYGGDGKEGLDKMIASARQGRPIPIVGRGGEPVCPVHIDDTVTTLVRSLSAGAAEGRTYTLAGECLTMLEFAHVCLRVFDSSSRVLRVPVPVVAGLAFAGRFLPLPIYPDQLARLRAPKPAPSPEAAADLDFRPRALEEGLRSLHPSPSSTD